MKKRYIIPFLFFLCIAVVIITGCVSTDDDNVIQAGHEGYDKIYENLVQVNDLQGTKLQLKFGDIFKQAKEYKIRMAALNPTTDKGKQIKAVMLDFFSYSELWSSQYSTALMTGKSSDYDAAAINKTKMMSAVKEMSTF